MDITTLDAVVRQLFSAGLANSTKRTYASGEKRYDHFCTQFGLTPYPASEYVLAYFVAFLYKEGLAPSSVKIYLSAIRHTQIALGMGDPRLGDMPQLEYVTKGLRRLSPGQSRSRLPITPHILRHLRASWEKTLPHFDGAMLWAAACMCFFGFLRCGEVVVPSDSTFDPTCHLASGDVRLDNTSNPQYIQVHIMASKMDPFRQGVSVYLGSTKGDICPVAAVVAYMVLRGAASGPFFRFADGRPLTRERLVAAVRAALREASIDDSNYSGHSFRIGAATTAAQQGVPDSLIKTLGRWESAAHTIYIRTPRETLCNVAQTLIE